jgi:hypothetical protein
MLEISPVNVHGDTYPGVTAKPGPAPKVRPLGNLPRISLVEDARKSYIPPGMDLGMDFARLFDSILLKEWNARVL